MSVSEKLKAKVLTRQEELMLALDVTEDDILANRNGQLLPEHKQKIFKRESRRLVPIGCGTLTILGLIFLVIMVIRNEGADDGFILLCEIIGLALMMISLGGFQAIRKLIQFRQDMQAGIVESIQGLAVVEAGRGYSLSMNDVRFEAPQQAILRIKHLEPHIIHYLPRSKIVVSVETVEE
jgi:hypothetical protein